VCCSPLLPLQKHLWLSERWYVSVRVLQRFDKEPFKKHVHSEGGRGYPRQHTRRYKGRGHFNGRMYTHAIFTR